MQEFGSWWSTALPAASPLIQGMFSFGGAALGGVVAMLTTKAVLAANVEREREARSEIRRKEREDRFREHCARYLTVVLDQVNWEQRQTDRLIQFCQRWSVGEGGIWFDDPTPDHLAELLTLETLQLPFLRGHVTELTQIVADMRNHRAEFASKIGPNTRFTLQIAESFNLVHIRHRGRLRAITELVAAKLVEQLSALDASKSG